MQRHPSSGLAFTLGELATVLSIIAILFFLFYPILAHKKGESPQYSCLSNVKQIGFGMMMYCQDFDEQFPPTYSLQTGANGPVLVPWGGRYPVAGENGRFIVDGLVFPYIKNPRAFRCPTVIHCGGRS
jgi:competence protein ComGC